MAVQYGTLFERTQDTMEALSGTLKTARRHGVVAYEGEQLWQGASDAVTITLLKRTHADLPVPRRRKRGTVPSKCTTAGFGAPSGAHAGNKCRACAKTVYATEYVGAGGHTFHRACFRCTDCDGKLKPNDYCVGADGSFRCAAHHREFEVGRASLAPVVACQ